MPRAFRGTPPPKDFKRHYTRSPDYSIGGRERFGVCTLRETINATKRSLPSAVLDTAHSLLNAFIRSLPDSLTRIPF